MTPADQHASMVLTLIGLGALALGTLAMALRWVSHQLANRGTTGREVAGQFVDDVKKGEGFTFHRPLMSRNRAGAPADRAIIGSVAGNLPEAGQRVAKPGNEVNTILPGNLLPEEAREIIRFQARVEAVVDLITSGEMGQTKAITIIFQCKASGRPDSTYARARDAVQARMTPAPHYRPLDDDKRPAELSEVEH